MGNLPAGMAGAVGLPAGVPVTTEITPVRWSATTRSMRGFDTGAVMVPVVCCAFDTSKPVSMMLPASTCTVMFGVAAACGAFAFAFGLPALAKEAHAQLVWRFAVPLAFL